LGNTSPRLPFNLPPFFIVDLAFNCANHAAMTIQHAIGQLQDPTQYKIWSSGRRVFEPNNALILLDGKGARCCGCLQYTQNCLCEFIPHD
jgi:hypothetical protein